VDVIPVTELLAIVSYVQVVRNSVFVLKPWSQIMPAVMKRSEKKLEPQVRFLGFSGTLMVFSDSPLIAKKDQQEPSKAPRPKS
jgi:uncharacterized membrane protein